MDLCLITFTFAPLFMMNSIDKIFPELGNSKNVVITMHQKPDGDAMGSSLGMYNFLIQFGHSVQVIAPTNWPGFLSWLPGADLVLNYEANKTKADEFVNNADWIFCLDFNVLSRTKDMELLLLAAPGKKILIDHHELPQFEVFDYGLSQPQKSSTAEMVFDIIKASGNLEKINNEVAQCIYTGIMTDTGSFRFPATNANVHAIVSALMEKGLDHTKIHEGIYDTGSEARLRFMGNALLNRLEVFYEYNSAIIAIPGTDVQKYDLKTGDTEGLVNYPLSIEGIKMAAILIDRGELRKWSFRSKGDFDVNMFARKHFNGGGHKNAAGGHSTESFESTLKKFQDVLVEYKNELSTYQF